MKVAENAHGTIIHRRRSPINIGRVNICDVYMQPHGVHSHNVGDEEQCRGAGRMHVKYIILGGLGACFPRGFGELFSC